MRHFVFQSAFNPLQSLILQRGNTALILFGHVCQLSDFIRAMFHIHLLRFPQCRSMNETTSALLKQQHVHAFCEPNFGAITQISGWSHGFLLFRSLFLFCQSIFFSCISCQSHMVSFNHLQTVLVTSHLFGSFPFAWLLPIQPVRLTHTVDHAFIQPGQINWFQQFKSAINVSFPT